MTGTHRISAEQEIAPLLREVQRLSAVVSEREAELAAIADAAVSLRTNPESVSRAFSQRAAHPCNDSEIERALQRLQRNLCLAAEDLAENTHAVEALRASWSWKVTAPLRGSLDAARLLLGVFRNGGRGLFEPRKIGGLVEWLRFRREIQASGLFDRANYLQANPDVFQLRIDPLLHFFVFGAREGRDPHCLFSLRYYRATNPEIASLKVNPLVHYLKFGGYQGLDPHPEFHSAYYLEQNPDVREAGINPLAHYIAPGVVEGRDPNPWFDTSEYLERNPDVAAFGMNPLAHHLEQEAEARLWAAGGG